MMKGKGVQGDLLGFAGSQGQNWKEQRSYFVSCLRRNWSNLNIILEEESLHLVKRLQVLSLQNKPIWMHHFFTPFAVNVIWRLISGNFRIGS